MSDDRAAALVADVIEDTAARAAREAAAQTAVALAGTVEVATVEADVAVTTAEAAIALANATAAAAELDAAERTRQLMEGLATWRTETEVILATLITGQEAMRAEISAVSSAMANLSLTRQTSNEEPPPGVEPESSTRTEPPENDADVQPVKKRRRWT